MIGPRGDGAWQMCQQDNQTLRAAMARGDRFLAETDVTLEDLQVDLCRAMAARDRAEDEVTRLRDAIYRMQNP